MMMNYEDPINEMLPITLLAGADAILEITGVSIKYKNEIYKLLSKYGVIKSITSQKNKIVVHFDDARDRDDVLKYKNKLIKELEKF